MNGTRAVVVGFDKKEGWPVVQTFAGEIMSAYPDEWKYEENGTIRAIISQVPLRLAWAITIHKSQGMTLDAAEIDLGDAFEPGMGYVALSRVRRLKGLKLMNLNEMALKVHPKILQQDKQFKTHSVEAEKMLQSLTEIDIQQQHGQLLNERFQSHKATTKKTLKVKKMPTHIITLNLLKEKISIDAIAKQRQLAVSTIIAHVEKLKGLKMVDEVILAHLKSAIPSVDFELIYAAMEKSDGALKSLYEQFNGKYSYNFLKMVRLF